MIRRAFILLSILLAALAAAGCSGTKSGIDTPKSIDESGSTLANNPALKAQNISVTAAIVQKPLAPGAAPGGELVIAGQFTLTWDPPPPPAIVDHYRVERKIGQGDTWVTIADEIPPSQRQLVDPGELGATHFYRVVTYDAGGNFGTSDEVSARIPTFCDYPSGWSMIWPVHGCARFEATFALDDQTTYFAGSNRVIIRSDFGLLAPPSDFGLLAPYQTIDLGPNVVLKDVCATDLHHVFAVGYVQAPREKAKGAAFVIEDGTVKRLDLGGLERGPLRRIFCNTAEKFYAGGDDGVFLTCGTNGCTPVAGIDDPSLGRPYAAIWGIPGQFIITGATLHSLVLARPDSPPEPLLPGQPSSADRETKDPVVFDLIGRGLWGQGALIATAIPSLLIATEEGLFHFSWWQGALRRIDDGNWRRLLGMSLGDIYAVGDGGIARFRESSEGRIEKVIEGPQRKFTSIHGTTTDRFYLTDSSGQIWRGDGNGHYESLLNISLDMLPQSRLVVDRTSSGQRITDIAAVGRRLAISWQGAAEGLVLFSPADGSMEPVREFHGADVSTLEPAGERLLIASSVGLFAMATTGDQAVTKLADGVFPSAWGCGEGRICAVTSPTIFGPMDSIVLVRPGGQPAVQQIAPPHHFTRFKQAAGSPADGLVAIVRGARSGGGERDGLLSYDGSGWKEEALPAPPDGTQSVALRIVSAPGERPILLATYTMGEEASYALIASRNGTWTAIERGDQLRTLVRILRSGERIDVNLDGFEPTAFTALNPYDLWAVANGQFLLRWTR